jgi:hypothetical protein
MRFLDVFFDECAGSRIICRNDDGKQYVEDIRNNQMGPRNNIHRKDVYL